MSVTRSQPITKTQLDQLATLANSSSIDGGPYSFRTQSQLDALSTGDRIIHNWRAELQRIRENAISELSDSGFIRNELIDSGPWTIWDNLGHTAQGATFTDGRKYKQVEYYYPDPSPASGETLDTVIFFRGLETDQNRPVPQDYSQQGHRGSSFSYSLVLEASSSGRFKGILFASTTARASFEFSGSLTSIKTSQTISSSGITIFFDGTISPGAFSIGVSITTPGVYFSGPPGWSGDYINIDGGSSNASFTHSNPNRELADNAIHNTKAVYKIKSPYELSTENVRIKYAVPSDYPFSNGRIYAETVSSVHYRPSANIESTGIWVAKTGSIPAISCNPIGDRLAPFQNENALNFKVTQPSPNVLVAERPEDPAPKVNAGLLRRVTPGVDFVIPCYPAHLDNGSTPPQGDERHIRRGTVVFKVFTARQPQLTSEGIYRAQTNDPSAVNITFGFYRNGSFVALPTPAKITKSETEVEVYPFWVIFTETPLSYQADQPVYIQPNIADSTATFLGIEDYSVGVTFPIVSEHYNETLAMLNLIN